ncbi:MAG TPA: aspartate aminotransferase family protein [Dongiaceae bacterium]|jgi:glutamate-1-semialdehyde 2,1-aminomutase
MSTADVAGIASGAIDAMRGRERALFEKKHPRSRELAAAAARNWFQGVPMHWMLDWGTPFPLFVREAQGATLTDADGNRHADFCLGDTGSMFGHSPAPIVEVLQRQGARGLTSMLPTEDAAEVGRLLAARFGVPFWQVTATATDANRYVLRWAREVTGRDKILVFHGCYHGSVDDTFIRLKDGRPIARPGLIGQVTDVTKTTKVVEFNDVAALEAALKPGDVACVLCEPAMTNIGMVLPEPGFHDALRRMTRKHGTLLAIDETHSISTGPGGYTRAHKLEPDFFVLGKPVAGGIPCAVFGFTADLAQKMAKAANAQAGYSGMGTTLSANPLVMAALRANLERVMTDAAYDHMLALSERLAEGLRQVIQERQLPWHVSNVGARAEFVCAAKPPRNGTEAGAAMQPTLEHAIHMYLINRGLLIAPFHNMTLVCPDTAEADVDHLIATVRNCCDELRAA